MFIEYIRFIIIYFAIIIPFALAGITLLDDVNGTDDSVREIVRLAKSAEIRNYIDESADPCRNFYKFACGNYYRINTPSATRLQSNFLQTISKSLNRKMLALLDNEITNDAPTDKKVKKFYKSCIKMDNLEAGDYKTRLEEIISDFGQMPVLQGDKWQEQQFDWLQTVAEIAYKYNLRIILGHLISVDNLNNTLNRMGILMQDIPLQTASVYTDPIHALLLKGHQTVITQNLQKFLNLNATLAEETAKELIEFETNLHAGYKKPETANNETVEETTTALPELIAETNTEQEGFTTTATPTDFNDLSIYKSTIEDMQNKYYPDLDIKRLVNISLGYIPSGQVYDFLEYDVANLVTVIQATPKRIVANYIFYQLIDKFFLATPEEKTSLQYFCIEITKGHFGKILDNMIYRKYASAKTEQAVVDMFDLIKGTFENVLQSTKLSWMSMETRKYALEKLKTIRMEINSYKHINFTEEFASLSVNDSDYVGNIQSLLTMNAMKSRVKLNETAKPYDDARFSITPIFVLTENLIKVPVSMLQPYYLWSDSYARALEFGSLGFLMSHELIHGFDDDGSFYDKSGNKREWWDKKSREYLQNSTACFSDQYHQYEYEGHQLPKRLEQTENIADNGGIRLSYQAFQNWHEQALHTNHKMDQEVMPRLNYTSKQLFFISYGQLWCSSTHPILRHFVASTDEHMPDEFRVVGALSNLQEFSKEFNCPIGSEMNPVKKCVIY